MALSLAAAAAKKLGSAAAKGAGKKPSAFSPEGVTMLSLAGIIELVNIVIGLLDIVVIGIVLGPIINFAAIVLIGGWLWMKTGKIPLKKGLGPFALNSIPLAKFIPWWFIAVATTLDWRGGGGEQTTQTQEQPQEPQPAQAAPQPV